MSNEMKEHTEKCKSQIEEHIAKGIWTRWECLSMVIGYFEDTYDSIPVELIDWIWNLCKEGRIKA